MSNTLPGNVVRHFKGGRYVVLHRATCTFNEAITGGTTPVIVYLSLQDGKIWVRPEVEFCDEVKWPDGFLRHRFIVDHPSEPHVVSEPLKTLNSEELARLALQAKVPVRTAYVWLTSGGRICDGDAACLEAAYKELFEEKK